MSEFFQDGRDSSLSDCTIESSARQPLATSLSLNCLNHGEVQEMMFVIEVEKTKSVSILKDLIKEKKATRLKDVDASDLNVFNLWMVDR